jgi:hypothetical protein
MPACPEDVPAGAFAPDRPADAVSDPVADCPDGVSAGDPVAGCLDEVSAGRFMSVCAEGVPAGVLVLVGSADRREVDASPS